MKKKKETNFLKKNYAESFRYISESRKYIYSIIIIFFSFSLVGYFFPAPPEIVEAIRKFIETLLEKTSSMGAFELSSFIFMNNLQSSFFGFIFGFAFGIFPIMGALFNGYLLGFVSRLVISQEGIFVLWRLLPHGIFELPAVFISLGMGLRFGSFIFSENKRKDFEYSFIQGLRVFFFVVFPLLLVAALIEGLLIFYFS